MKRTALKKIVSLICAGIMTFSVMAPLSASADWVKNDDGTKSYCTEDGKTVTKKRIKIGGKYYYFDKNGKMVTKKWVTINKTKYYFRADGSMAVNCTLKIGGKSYVFDSKGKSKVKTASSKETASIDLWSHFEGMKWGMSHENVIKKLGLKDGDYTWDGELLEVTKIGKDESSDIISYDYYFYQGLKTYGITMKPKKSLFNQIKNEFDTTKWEFVGDRKIGKSYEEYVYENDTYKVTLSITKMSLCFALEKKK